METESQRSHYSELNRIIEHVETSPLVAAALESAVNHLMQRFPTYTGEQVQTLIGNALDNYLQRIAIYVESKRIWDANQEADVK